MIKTTTDTTELKTEFCTFLDNMDMNGRIVLVPIGKAKNAVNKPTLSGWKELVTEIILYTQYTKGLNGIEDYSHVVIVYWMGQEKECHLKHHPQGRTDVPYGGIFACRCP